MSEKQKEAKIIQMMVECGKSKEGHTWKISMEQKMVNDWIRNKGTMATMPLFNMGMQSPPPAPTHRCTKCNHQKGVNRYNLIDDDPHPQHSMMKDVEN